MPTLPLTRDVDRGARRVSFPGVAEPSLHAERLGVLDGLLLVADAQSSTEARIAQVFARDLTRLSGLPDGSGAQAIRSEFASNPDSSG